MKTVKAKDIKVGDRMVGHEYWSPTNGDSAILISKKKLSGGVYKLKFKEPDGHVSGDNFPGNAKLFID